MTDKEKAQQIGELVQIDHMVLNLYNGLSIKEFRAVCPINLKGLPECYGEKCKRFLEAYVIRV